MDQFNIYALSCENNKYYVGKTKKTIIEIFREHCSSDNNITWTKIYKPLEIVETIIDNAWKEDSLTLEYMLKYGIDDVRGGSYPYMFINSTTREEIQNKLSQYRVENIINSSYRKEEPILKESKNQKMITEKRERDENKEMEKFFGVKETTSCNTCSFL